jgi:hypothetical protein
LTEPVLVRWKKLRSLRACDIAASLIDRSAGIAAKNTRARRPRSCVAEGGFRFFCEDPGSGLFLSSGRGAQVIAPA